MAPTNGTSESWARCATIHAVVANIANARTNLITRTMSVANIAAGKHTKALNGTVWTSVRNVTKASPSWRAHSVIATGQPIDRWTLAAARFASVRCVAHAHSCDLVACAVTAAHYPRRIASAHNAAICRVVAYWARVLGLTDRSRQMTARSTNVPLDIPQQTPTFNANPVPAPTATIAR